MRERYNKAFLREEGGPRSVEGACDNSDLAMLNFFITHSPSPSFVGSSLPEGAFVTASERKTEGQIKNILSDVSEGAV